MSLILDHPADIILAIIMNLHYHDINTLYQVCKHLKRFYMINQRQILYNYLKRTVSFNIDNCSTRSLKTISRITYYQYYISFDKFNICNIEYYNQSVAWIPDCSIRLYYQFGNDLLKDCLIEGPEVTTQSGIIKYGKNYGIRINDNYKISDIINSIYYHCQQFIKRHIVKINYVHKREIITQLDDMYFDRLAATFFKLTKDSLFVDRTGVEIKITQAMGIPMSFIPLLQIKSVNVVDYQAQIIITIKSAVITSILLEREDIADPILLEKDDIIPLETESAIESPIPNGFDDYDNIINVNYLHFDVEHLGNGYPTSEFKRIKSQYCSTYYNIRLTYMSQNNLFAIEGCEINFPHGITRDKLTNQPQLIGYFDPTDKFLNVINIIYDKCKKIAYNNKKEIKMFNLELDTTAEFPDPISYSKSEEITGYSRPKTEILIFFNISDQTIFYNKETNNIPHENLNIRLIAIPTIYFNIYVYNKVKLQMYIKSAKVIHIGDKLMQLTTLDTLNKHTLLK